MLLCVPKIDILEVFTSKKWLFFPLLNCGCVCRSATSNYTPHKINASEVIDVLVKILFGCLHLGGLLR